MQKGNVIILILGIIAFAAGIFVHFEEKSFHKKSKMTEGKIVYVLASAYKIQYFTDDGTEKIMRGSSKLHSFREGMKTNVWYRIDDPDRVRLSDGKKAGKTLFIVAAFCILMGIYPLFLKTGAASQKPLA